MSKKQIITFSFALLVVGLCIVMIISKLSPDEQQVITHRDFPTIQNSGYIRVGILQNNTDYYMENSEIQGFHYELVESFAKHAKLKTHYIIYDTYWDYFFALLNYEVDFLAMDINSNYQRDMFFSYTHPHSYSTHVLVRRKNDTTEKQTILLAIPSFSSFYEDALRLCLNMGLSAVDLQVKESLNTDYFLDLLTDKEIDLTIEDKKIMNANSLLYQKLDYSTELTDSLPLHWVVNKGNHTLQTALNHWLDSLKDTRLYPVLLNKYYSPKSQNRQKLAKQSYKISNGAISIYDSLIKKQSQRYGLDWRLVAAIIHQESRFRPDIIGKGGSFGLMQLMPQTVSSLNISDPYSIEGQIVSGCKLLNRLIKRYAEKGVSDTTDLYKFALAAYNAGHGRIDNVILLAEATGHNPHCWNSIEKMLPKMSDKTYIKNAGLNITSYNGKYTKDYVSRVWIVYCHYQNMVD